MKKTAIDWLVDKINTDCLNSTYVRIDLIQQAKQMEKEQMVEFAEDYIDYHCYADFDNQITYDKTATEYFNETYKGGNDD